MEYSLWDVETNRYLGRFAEEKDALALVRIMMSVISIFMIGPRWHWTREIFSTDGAPSGIGYNDGLFKVTLDGQERGKVEQFLSVPRDAETCGPVIKDDEGMVYVAVQHPERPPLPRLPENARQFLLQLCGGKFGFVIDGRVK